MFNLAFTITQLCNILRLYGGDRMEELNKRISNNIRAERCRKNLTADEVSEKLNISRNTYYTYETEANNVTVATLLKLSEIFNCEVTKFFV